MIADDIRLPDKKPAGDAVADALAEYEAAMRTSSEAGIEHDRAECAFQEANQKLREAIQRRIEDTTKLTA